MLNSRETPEDEEEDRLPLLSDSTQVVQQRKTSSPVYLGLIAILAISGFMALKTYLRKSADSIVNQNLADANTDVFDCSSLPADASSRSLWEQYVFEACTGPKLQPKCLPRMFPPSDSSKPPAGLLIYFHGYSSCPYSAVPFAKYLTQNENFYVYTFLLPGHGRVYGDCVNPNECANGWPTESIPSNRQPYIDMVKRAIQITRSEVRRLGLQGKNIVVSGLSHGGAASVYAAALAPDLFTHQLTLNAFLGISSVVVDDIQTKCTPMGSEQDKCIEGALNATMQVFGFNNQTAQLAIGLEQVAVESFLQYAAQTKMTFLEKWAFAMNILRNDVATLVESAKMIPLNITGFLDSTFGWTGDSCMKAVHEAGRGGFCYFKVKNILAAHSFGNYALAQSRIHSSKTAVQFMTVQRDGPTRVSLEWEILQSAARNGASASVCMFRAANGCTDNTDGNTCGVPHSMLDPLDNILRTPFNIYWQSFLYSAAASFVSGRAKSIGVTSFTGSNIGECVIDNVKRPDITRVGVVIKGGILQLESGFVVNSEKVDSLIFNSLVSQLKQPFWAITFVRLEDPSQQGLNRFLIQFPESIRPDVIQSIKNGSLSSLIGTKITRYYDELYETYYTPPGV